MMMLFAERFTDAEILTTLSSKLSWSHFTELLRLKSDEARLYYANLSAEKGLGIRGLRHQISRKAYERREIANTQLTEASSVPFNAFKGYYSVGYQTNSSLPVPTILAHISEAIQSQRIQ